jgi:hypothetical protein
MQSQECARKGNQRRLVILSEAKNRHPDIVLGKVILRFAQNDKGE